MHYATALQLAEVQLIILEFAVLSCGLIGVQLIKPQEKERVGAKKMPL